MQKKVETKTKYYKFSGQLEYLKNNKLIRFNGKIVKSDKEGNIIDGEGILECKSEIYGRAFLQGQIFNNYLLYTGTINLNDQIKLTGNFTQEQQEQLINIIQLSENNIFQSQIMQNKIIEFKNITFNVQTINDIVQGKIITKNFTYTGSFLPDYPYKFIGFGIQQSNQTGTTIQCDNWNNNQKNGQTIIKYGKPDKDNLIEQTSIYKDNTLIKHIQLVYTDRKITYNQDNTVTVVINQYDGQFIGKNLKGNKLDGTFKYYHDSIIETNIYKQDILIQRISYEDNEKIVTFDKNQSIIQFKQNNQMYIGQINDQYQMDGYGTLKDENKEFEGLFQNNNKQGNFRITSPEEIEVVKYRNNILCQHFWKYNIKEKLYTKFDKSQIKFTFTGDLDSDYLPNGYGILNEKGKEYDCEMENGVLISKQLINSNASQQSMLVTYNPSQSGHHMTKLSSEDFIGYKEINLCNSKNKTYEYNNSFNYSNIKSNISAQQTKSSEQDIQLLSQEIQQYNNQKTKYQQQNQINNYNNNSKYTNYNNQIEESDGDIINMDNNTQSISDDEYMIDNNDTITYFNNKQNGKIYDKQTGLLIYKGEINDQGDANGIGIMHIEGDTFIQALFNNNQIVKVIKEIHTEQEDS